MLSGSMLHLDITCELSTILRNILAVVVCSVLIVVSPSISLLCMLSFERFLIKSQTALVTVSIYGLRK